MFINPRTEEMNAVDDTGGLEMPLPEETTSHVDLEDHVRPHIDFLNDIRVHISCK